MPHNFTDGIVRILHQGGQTSGTGFVVSDDGLIVTCAHVIMATGAEPGDVIDLVLYATGEQRQAIVEREYWHDSDAEDIAFLRLQGALPKEVGRLPLGNSICVDGHLFSTYGFPDRDSLDGMRGSGKILGHKKRGALTVLQLWSEEVTLGFSGAPIWDDSVQIVVGMVSSTTTNKEVRIGGQTITIPSDPNERFTFTSFATPTEMLLMACSALQFSSECPYRQLVAFSEADAPFFFGREAFVESLVKHLHENPRFLAVFGPSGSGKSSLVQAGLIPQLRKDAILGSKHWKVIVTRPSDDPLYLLPQLQLGNVSSLFEGIQFWLRQHLERTDRVLLVIDQFEEIFVAKETVRDTFLAQLVELLDTSRRVTLIIVMRDDFYSQFVGLEALRRWLDESKGAVNVPQILTRRDLEAIICEPARRANVHINEGLVDIIIKDVMEGKQEVSSTILPLLEFALTQLWEKRQRETETLTIEAYKNMDGIAGEFTSWANVTYDHLIEKLPLARRHLVQRIFTDLVHLENESLQQPDSRQRKPLVALCRPESESKFIEEIVQQLVQARLLVKNEGTVEIIHDVLLREWGYLRSWIKDNRAYLEWHQRLKEKFHDWEKTKFEYSRKHDGHKLLAGGDLVQAASYLQRYKDDLTTQDQFFIRMSEKRQRREVNIWRGIGMILLVLLLLVGGLAEWASLNLQQAQAEKRVAFAHALVAQSGTYLLKHQYDLALLLSIKAYQTENDYDTRSGLLTALEGTSQVNTILHEKNLPSPPNFLQSSVVGLAFSINGHMLISAHADGRVALWNTSTGEQHSVHIPNIVALSPRGKMAVTIGSNGSDSPWLWDAQAGTKIIRLSGPLLLNPMEDAPPFTFSPDEHVLAVNENGRLVLWDTASRKPIGTLLTGLSDYSIGHMAFSPDNKLLAVSICESGNQVYDNGGNPLYCGRSDILLWDVASRSRLGSPLKSNQIGVRSIAFSPNDRLLATGGTDNTIVLWDTTTQQPLGEPLLGHTAWVESLFFNPDGKLLASGSNDHTVRLWDVAARREIGEPLLGHQTSVSTVTFSPDGQSLASSDTDNTMIIWNVTSSSHLSQPLKLGEYLSDADISFGPFTDSLAYNEAGSIYIHNLKTGMRTAILNPSGPRKSGNASLEDIGSVALSSNPRTLATYSKDGTIILWDMTTRKPTQSFKDVDQSGPAIALSLDGRTLATCCSVNTKTITLRDVATGRIIHRMTSRDEIYSMAISPDGSMIASGDSAGVVTLWNVATTVGQPLTGHMDTINRVLFSPDGKILAARGSNGALLLWDMTDQKQIDPPPLQDDPDFYSTGMAFSPDGDILALASSSITGSSIILWDVKKHELVAHPISSSSIVEDLIFGLHGQLLSTANVGHGVVILSFTLWDVNVDSWVDRACSIANRNLTVAEWNQFVSGEPYSKVCPRLAS